MGLTFRGTDIQTANIFLDITRGYAEPAAVRGRDIIIVGRAGRTETSVVRKKDVRRILLEGWVLGTGASLVLKQQSWRSSTDTLMALMDHTLASGALVVSTPYMGLPSGSKTIQAKCINVMPGPIVSLYFQRWSIELEAIGNPPDWA